MQCKKGEYLGADEIITMDWLTENVIGKIPELEELEEDALELVAFQGIKVDESGTDKKAGTQSEKPDGSVGAE